jgi:hypothetical protein
MGYDTGKLSDINTERTIPAGTEVSVVLSEPAQVGNTKPDGSGSPKIELLFKVEGGPFANFRIREQLWINTVPKEGKEKPPWETQARPTIAKIYKGYVPVPKPMYGNAGEETPESKTLRAPVLAKMDQFLAGVKSPDDVAARLSTFTGKKCRVKVGIDTFNNKTKNVISEYLAA